MGKVAFYHSKDTMITVEQTEGGQRFKATTLPRDVELDDNRTVLKTALLVYLRDVIASFQSIEQKVAESEQNEWQVQDPMDADDCPF